MIQILGFIFFIAAIWAIATFGVYGLLVFPVFGIIIFLVALGQRLKS